MSSRVDKRILRISGLSGCMTLNWFDIYGKSLRQYKKAEEVYSAAIENEKGRNFIKFRGRK